MVIRRIGPLSAAKIAGLLYALMGLVFGAFVSIFAVAGAMPKDDGMAGLMFGMGAIIALPIFYGILGFVMTLIAAALYNLVARLIGGIEIDLQ